MGSTSIVDLKEGDLVVTGEPLVVEVVVGAGVVVCLFSKEKALGGVSYFVEGSEKSTASSQEKLLYAVEAIPLLLEEVSKISGGERPTDLVAKVIGGAELTGEPRPVEKILKQTFETLEKLSIPVMGKSVGGSQRIRAFFEPTTGRLRVAPIEEETLVLENPVAEPKAPALKKKKTNEIPAEPLWSKT
jgi:chemotaxis receptor (MCP) glutamine deamidase CheD